jgi:hypothetical protein
VPCEILSSMAPSSLSHGDCAPGAGVEDCITRARRLWQAELGSLPRCRVLLDVVPLQPSSSTHTVTGFRLGGYPVGRDWWGGKRDAGGMSEDHDRCFSMLVLGAFSTGVFQTPMHYPALTLSTMCGQIKHHDRCLLTLVLVYFAHWMGSV